MRDLLRNSEYLSEEWGVYKISLKIPHPAVLKLPFLTKK